MHIAYSSFLLLVLTHLLLIAHLLLVKAEWSLRPKDLLDCFLRGEIREADQSVLLALAFFPDRLG